MLSSGWQVMFRYGVVSLVLLSPAMPLRAQTASAPAAAGAPTQRILGTVSALGDGSVTVHRENGGENGSGGDIVVTLTAQTRLLRTVPGATSLKDATPLQKEDLAVDDRVLIRPSPSAGDPAHPVATVLVAMKGSDIAQAHAQESAQWQRNGASGIVQTVKTIQMVQTVQTPDAPGSEITLRASGSAQPVVIHATAATVVRRYAPESTAFADAHKSTLADVHPGDQLRARGTKSADGLSVDAQEIVVGTFRNIAGTVLGTDPGANSLSVTDLATKKPITLHLGPGAQLRKLPPEMAARLAHREAPAGAPAAAPAASGAAPDNSATPPGDTRPRTGGRGDAASLLGRAPVITLADLKKGDAVMIVASGPGAAEPTAITLIAGVEPLLQASPEASAGLFSASWNLGGGGDAGGGEGGAPR